MADITPVTREEYYLAKAGGQDVPTPTPVPREEQYLAKLSGQDVNVPTPITRREKFLYAASGGDIELPSEDKMRRIEKFMAKAGGRDVTTPTPVPREEQFWDAIIAESGIKTLTGRLPLFFKTTDTKLRDWIIYGNNDVGKNLLEITEESRTISGVTFTIDKQAGTITANGTANSGAYLNLPINAPSGDYYYSGCALGGSASTYDLFAWDNTISGRPKKWDGETNVDSDYGGTSQEIKVDSEHSMQLTIRIRRGYTCNNLVFKPMLRKSGTSAAFEPYQAGVGEKTENGYVLNIIVGFAPITEQPAAHLYSSKTINLGESPLTEGQTLSMSEFGDISIAPYSDVFIAAVESRNLEAPLSYNQPEMKIKYKE